MNWDAIGAVAETLGAIGVIATLAYLAVQIRQNSRELSSSSRRATQSSIFAQNLQAAENPELVALLMKGMNNYSELAPEERARFHYYWQTTFITYQEAFLELGPDIERETSGGCLKGGCATL